MKYRIIGLYELITGIFGVLLLIFNIGKAFDDPGAIFSFILGILLYAGTAYAGYALINSLRHCIKISIFTQIFQSVSFIGGGIQYLFTASAFLSLIYRQDLNMKFQIAPIAYNISKVSEFIPFELKIFVVPVIMAVLLIIQD
jgi:hypothetical protein